MSLCGYFLYARVTLGALWSNFGVTLVYEGAFRVTLGQLWGCVYEGGFGLLWDHCGATLGV